MALKLHTIIASTRPGRIGPAVAEWFDAYAREHGPFENHLIDLADFELPVYDEPNHPSTQKYEHEHTKAWSQSVAAADAYVFVIPEYNHTAPPSLINALNYVYTEWNEKPCAIVSYGGASGGVRAAQTLTSMVTTLKMMPIPEGVMVQMAWELLNEQGKFTAGPEHEDSARSLLKELERWAKALRTMRTA